MTFTAEQKSQLAKLLATENLTVQHQKIRTAKFDPANRVLYLPIWQNMSGAMYDLLVGHEVGHALYTPAEGWHDAIVKNAKGRYFKNFLNVVEDARIEKKVQRKYPGLKRQFITAYADLINRDFFGTKNSDINEMSFIDRLNVFSKSQWMNTNILFNTTEKALIDQVQSVETWDDVLRVTGAVFDYSKEEQKEMQLEQFEQMMTNDYSDEEYDDYEEYDEYNPDGDSSEETDDADNNRNKNTIEEGDGKGITTKPSDKDEGNIEDDSPESQFNRFKESKESWEDQFDPTCETDQEFRRNESMLLDEKCKEVVYVTIPKPILKNIITPAKRVHELHSFYVKEFVADGRLKLRLANELFREFKNRNDRYIGLLAKEFEMRKAARAFSKAKISDTGDIDINKLASYNFDENIFRKIMSVPKGKSHGLILLLDKSGSMSRNMSGSIEQILVLTMFCRKVNIPFAVYGFGASPAVRMIDTRTYQDTQKEHYCFSNNINEIQVSNVYMREYLNSKMSNVEFTQATKYMLLIKEAFDNEAKGRWGPRRCPMFETEEMSNTPMTETLIATAEIMRDFKQKNNLDITNLVIVHDGDSDYNNAYWTDKTSSDGKVFRTNDYYDHFSTNYYLTDAKYRFTKQLNRNSESLFRCVLEWFTKVTDSKIFGFFICETHRGASKYAIENRYYVNGVPLGEMRNTNFQNYNSYRDILSEKQKELRNEKFLLSKSPGYDSFFLIAGGSELNTEEEEIEIEGKMTTKKMVNAFIKFNKKKAVNRVLVSKFIQGIAA